MSETEPEVTVQAGLASASGSAGTISPAVGASAGLAEGSAAVPGHDEDEE